MKLIGLMCARNEDWCIGLSARVALKWVDHLVILIHSSTDDTTKIAWQVHLEHPGRVSIMEDTRVTWHEMQMRQHMLLAARKLGATHIAMIDADEVVTGNYICWLKRVQIPDKAMLRLPGYNLRGGLNRYHFTGVWSDRWFSLAFKDEDLLSWSGNKFHSREPGGCRFETYAPVKQGEGGIMHLWGASELRLVAKHRLYKLTERIRWPDKSIEEIDRMYSWAITGGKPYEDSSTWKFADVPKEWWEPYADLMQHLNVDAIPWQEAECKRLIMEHGRGYFKGLDLFE